MKRTVLLMAGVLVLACGPAGADRVLLAPAGQVLSPGSLRWETAVRGSDSGDNIQWLQAGLPGVELEVVRDDRPGRGADWTAGAQVAIFPGTASLPALSAGVRDIADQTRFGRAYYIVAGAPMPVAVPPFSSLRLNAGVGADGIKGAFGSVEMDGPSRLRLLAEFDSRRLNFGLELPVASFLKLRASLLGGDAFYGVNLTFGGASREAPDFGLDFEF
ncbi:MAG: hypothetical protein WHZ52_06880 [Armatimonadota bacterium]